MAHLAPGIEGLAVEVERLVPLAEIIVGAAGLLRTCPHSSNHERSDLAATHHCTCLNKAKEGPVPLGSGGLRLYEWIGGVMGEASPTKKSHYNRNSRALRSCASDPVISTSINSPGFRFFTLLT